MMTAPIASTIATPIANTIIALVLFFRGVRNATQKGSKIPQLWDYVKSSVAICKQDSLVHGFMRAGQQNFSKRKNGGIKDTYQLG